MIGTTKALEKIIGEHIMRNFSKKEDWRLIVEPTGAVPSINSIYELEQWLPSILPWTVSGNMNNFNVQVIEYYDGTEYMNISAAAAPVCGIVGYEDITTLSSWLELSTTISGTEVLYMTANVLSSVPVYSDSLCGYVVTGGNLRYWEGENLENSIALSEHTSAEISAFYENIGLLDALYSQTELLTSQYTLSSDRFQHAYDFVNNIYDINAVSGFNRSSVYSEVTA